MRIKSDVGAKGYLKDVVFEDMNLVNVHKSIVVDMFYAGSDSKTNFDIKNITFRNINAIDSHDPGYFMCSDDSPCHEIVMENVHHGF